MLNSCRFSIRVVHEGSEANNDLMDSAAPIQLTPTVFLSGLSFGVGNELRRGQELKWSPENGAFSSAFFPPFRPSLSSLASSLGLLVRPSPTLARIPAGDKNNRLFHYWPLASPKVHYGDQTCHQVHFQHGIFNNFCSIGQFTKNLFNNRQFHQQHHSTIGQFNNFKFNVSQLNNSVMVNSTTKILNRSRRVGMAESRG